MKNEVKIETNTNKNIVSKQKNKDLKKKIKYPGKKATTITLILQIIIVLSLGIIALAPVATAFFGIFIGFLAAIALVISSVFTLFTILIADEVRQFWKNTFAWVQKVFDSGDSIKEALKGSIIWISLLMFVASLSGFIVNLIFFIKHKQNKAKFIVSCVFLALAIFNLVLALVVYLQK